MAGIYREPVMAGVMLIGIVLTGVLTGGPSAARASAGACPAGQITGSAATPTGAGYWLVDSGGDVFSFGDARFAGSVGGKSQSKPLRKPVVAIVPTWSGSGYWEVAADGAVFPLGGAPAHGSMGGKPLSKPITSVSTTPAGDGYWLVGAGGGVFAFGGSAFLGNALTSLSCATSAPTASGSVIVQYATNIMKGQPEPGWGRSHARPARPLASTAPASPAGSTRWPTAVTSWAGATPIPNCP
jgi:hypothetical protein